MAGDAQEFREKERIRICLPAWVFLRLIAVARFIHAVIRYMGIYYVTIFQVKIEYWLVLSCCYLVELIIPMVQTGGIEGIFGAAGSDRRMHSVTRRK